MQEAMTLSNKTAKAMYQLSVSGVTGGVKRKATIRTAKIANAHFHFL